MNSLKTLNYILFLITCAAFASCTESVCSSNGATLSAPSTKEVKKEAGFFESIFKKPKPASLAMMEYIQWVENPENGLKKSKTYGNYKFALQHLPLNYRALQSLKKKTINRETLESEILDLQDLDYYTFTIATTGRQQDILKADISGNGEFQERISYFSFGMQNDLMLIEGKLFGLVMLPFIVDQLYATPPLPFNVIIESRQFMLFRLEEIVILGKEISSTIVMLSRLEHPLGLAALIIYVPGLFIVIVAELLFVIILPFMVFH